MKPYIELKNTIKHFDKALSQDQINQCYEYLDFRVYAFNEHPIAKMSLQNYLGMNIDEFHAYKAKTLF